jgi:hypothetical protein
VLRLDPVVINLADLSPVVQQAAAPDAPIERRLMLARAAVPLPPDELLLALCFLAANDKAAPVANQARESIESLPWGVMESALPSLTHAGVLDHLAREHGRTHDELWPMIASNRNTDDVTIAWIASKGRGPVLEQISANQMRYQRCPMIVEALYYNAETRMGTVSTVLENAVRLGVDLSHIPGYQEIVASILGPAAVAKVTPAGAKAASPGAPEHPPVPPTADPGEPVVLTDAEQEGTPDEELARLLAAAAAEDAAAGATGGEPGEALDEDTFFAVLQEAATAADAVDGDKAPETERESAALWAKISKMSVAQRVRAALLGDESVRALLIRDTRRMVYLSVLKSPRLTDKEIAGFAKSRNMNEEVIRLIASDRDWTKNYVVKLALVSNPKCPPNTATNFLRVMTNKDIKQISGSRDVPGYVARQAKQILANRDQGKRN